MSDDQVPIPKETPMSNFQCPRQPAVHRAFGYSCLGIFLALGIRHGTLTTNHERFEIRPNTGMKTPNTKVQTPEKSQSPNPNRRCEFGASWEVEIWCFSGVWTLGFGVSPK